jgi:hypothetical protein
MSDFEKVIGSIIILFTISHFIDQYYGENVSQKPQKSAIKPEQSGEQSVEQKVKSVKFDLGQVESELKTQVKQQVNEFVEKELEKTERTGVMSQELMHIMTNELTSAYDPYDPMDFSFAAKDEQIKYSELPEYVNMTQNKYVPKPEPKQPARPSKNYAVDGMDYYNPCSDDQFGFVSANNISSGDFAQF